jgi:hypothetical protein
LPRRKGSDSNGFLKLAEKIPEMTGKTRRPTRPNGRLRYQVREVIKQIDKIQSQMRERLIFDPVEKPLSIDAAVRLEAFAN